jgi:hypothetical protein
MLAEKVIWEVHGANNSQETRHPDVHVVSCGFSQSLQTNVHAVSSKSFPVKQLQIILPFNTLTLKAS